MNECECVEKPGLMLDSQPELVSHSDPAQTHSNLPTSHLKLTYNSPKAFPHLTAPQ